MKPIKTGLLLIGTFFSLFSFAQGGNFVVPENTQIQMKFDQDYREKKNKVGEIAKLSVLEDVLVNGKVVVAKGASVDAKVTNSKKFELRVDIYSASAVDGTKLILNDCWVFTTAAQNYKSKGALIVTGTKKNCFVKEATKINAK